MRSRFGVVVVSLVSALSLLLGAQTATLTLPEGYRFPIASDRGDDPTQNFHIVGDFNGDSLQDDVWLLPRSDNHGAAVVMFLGAKNGGHQVLMLFQDSRPTPPGESPIQRLSIEVQKPGRYKTACGIGFYKCERGEPAELKLRLPTVAFFYEEVESVFWWNASSKRFIRTAMDD